jgi:putative selenium metabolism protein SsnA
MKANQTLLIKNATVATLGANNRVLLRHAVLCTGDKITDVGPDEKFAGQYDKVIDARGRVLMPGLVNAHMHFYSTLVCGLGKAAPSCNFTEVLENLWWRLDKKLLLQDCYYSALIPLVGAVRRGCTTIIDHHASPFAARGSLAMIAKAVKETGLRACLCYELSDRDGNKVAEDGIEENVEFIKYCRQQRDPQLAALFGLHAAFTIGDRTMEKAARAGHEMETGFHIHCAEAASDQEFSVKNHGMRVVERLHKFGILGPKTIAAHCVHVDAREMDILAQTQTAVVHNPQSNLNNAVGIADVVGMVKKGILVGLGTDAMTVNMLEELRVALWAQHLRQNNPGAGFGEVLSTLPFNNPQIAARCFNMPLGELREGFAADMIIVDYLPATPFDAGNFLGHLAFGIAQADVDTTIAGGRVLMEHRQLKLDIDLEEMARRSQALATSLWERF